ncbi:hypothetical protein M7I_6317 [Glarea lozoyensis 74030]|uniref:Uncharacterized protein n=1 Tax=Glarea lozoyensis (strain ATCC 74030 / MF5533) TaxID=1104152 RepID=H0EU86_GLAL7|nr:hypothetical protein M7I_6317 [Glarea lozoyensis 74030]
MVRGQWICDIRFVRFIITRNKLVDIDLHSRVEGRILETIPPVNHGDYSYDPKPIRHEPPVGHRTMMHRYCCPKACDLSHCLKRFPGYCQEQVRIQDDADDEIAWGIELVEGADLAYAWVFMLLIMGSSITFGIGWAVVRKDLSGGFATPIHLV